MKTKQRAIISLGGSLMIPDAIDTAFIQRFIVEITALSRTHNIVVFCGGGRTARNYQHALSAFSSISDEAKDWVGIQSSILNATLLSKALGDMTDGKIITDPRIKLSWRKSVYVGAGWKPGRSTDYDAVRLAVENNIAVVVNLSNVEYVYSADPRTNLSAQKFEHMTWTELRKVVGTRWSPGMNTPFDPIAAGIAQKAGISVKFLHGKYLSELPKALAGKTFHGTDIRP
ncbi:MAG: UMP kinase [Candidatus Kerfeldbacteria bacterium]|nr:UMP kinase [Candidatus Kerfeldbacteria bacterium]